jgi:hypothetical protein
MIENKIKEIQEYFKEKILKWEFELRVNGATLTILVDWDYVFTFYIKYWSETIEQWTDIWDDNSFLLNLSKKEGKELYKYFLKKWLIDKIFVERQKKQKLEQYEKLKEELGL